MAKDQAEEVRAIMLESARVQLAAFNAGIAFWTNWVDSASTYATALGRELVNVMDKGVDADATLGRLTDASRAYLRQIADLPTIVADEFNAELAAPATSADEAGTTGTTSPRPKRTRAARVKE